LLDESFRKDFPLKPSFTNRNEAKRTMQQMLDKGYLLCVEKLKPKVLQPSHAQDFNDERFYVWLYQDPAAQRWAIIKGVLLVVAVFTIILFPMWPMELRLGAWYLSVGALILFGILIAILIIRVPVFYISRLVTPPGIWVFPNINEDVSFFDSFKPVWDYDQPDKNAKRAAARRKRRDEHGSGSENRSGSHHEDGDNDDDDVAASTEGATNAEGTSTSSAPSSASSSSVQHQQSTQRNAGAATTEGGADLRKRNIPVGKTKIGTLEQRVDSENDGDNEGGGGAENETENDNETVPTPEKQKSKTQ
jgi:translocation protein SEC62